MSDDIKEDVKESSDDIEERVKPKDNIIKKDTKKSKALSQKNAAYYSENNIDSVKTKVREVLIDNSRKIKVIQRKEYKEPTGSTAKKGVIKNSLIGYKKNENWRIDKGVPKDIKEEY